MAQYNKSIPNSDRVNFVPQHVGPKIFPNSPLFSRLLRLGHRRPPRLVVRDDRLGVEKTHIQLLTDVLALRTAVGAVLPSTIQEDLDRGAEIYIGVLAAGGYEYAVAVLAVLALGAAVVPMSPAVPVEEAAYYVEKSRQVALLTSTATRTLGIELSRNSSAKRQSTLPCLVIAQYLQDSPLAPRDIHVSSDRYLNDNDAGVVIFTSGTTGPPKGAVMRRGYIHDAALGMADQYEISAKDVLLHVLPVHHATGIGVMFFPFLISGALIEFRGGSFDPSWMWNRWRRGGLTFFSGVPTMYMRMKRYFEQNLAGMPRKELDQYIAGARQFRAMLCGTSALPGPIAQFWTDIRGGKRILTRYGATEFGAPFKVHLDPKGTPEGSVGELVPGSEVKLSDGDEGEVLVKSPQMFSRYLFDDDATAKAHDSEGFFKTGDIARREGHYYFILGRASLDIIKSGGYKISALDIERECLALPYVEEAMVVGVEDEEFGQRVAAVISLRGDQENYSAPGKDGRRILTIEDLRMGLRDQLAGYKMPTLLKVVEGELPKTATGKILKRVLGPKYFPPNWRGERDVQAWHPRSSSRL